MKKILAVDTAYSSRGIVVRTQDDIQSYWQYDGLLTKSESRKNGFYSIYIGEIQHNDFKMERKGIKKYVVKFVILTPKEIYWKSKTFEVKQGQDIMKIAKRFIPELKILDSKYQEVKSAQQERNNRKSKKDESGGSSQSQPE